MAATPGLADAWTTEGGRDNAAPLAKVQQAHSALVMTCPVSDSEPPTLMLSLSQARMASLPRVVQTLLITDDPYTLFTPAFLLHTTEDVQYLRAVRTPRGLREALQSAKTVDLVIEGEVYTTFALTGSRWAIDHMLELCAQWTPPSPTDVAGDDGGEALDPLNGRASAGQ